MPLSHRVARFNRRVTNRITGPFASRLPGFAILYHIGRRSGRVFATPINIFRDGDDYIIALTYGPDTDWVKNVRAAGGCEVLTRGQRIRLVNPRIAADGVRRWAPPFVRFALGLADVPHSLRLTRVAQATAADAVAAPRGP